MLGLSGLLLRELRGGGVHFCAGERKGGDIYTLGFCVFLVVGGVHCMFFLVGFFGTGVIGIYERDDLLQTGLDSAYGGRS